MATTEDMLSWMEDYPEVYVRIVEITKDAIAFQMSSQQIQPHCQSHSDLLF